MRTDSEIKQAVEDELRLDPHVEETEVGVEVENGIVTLTGIVDNYIKRFAAEEAAHRVPDVLDVVNDIEVKLPGDSVRTDTEIAQAVRRALTWDVDVPEERIRTTVSHGFVTLGGTVDALHQREAAERAVRSVVGVRGVANQIAVGVPPVNPGVVRAEIESALTRWAAQAARRIEVTVEDGAVTLSGPVHSSAERRAVIEAVRYTPGVRSVVDQLYVETEAEAVLP